MMDWGALVGTAMFLLKVLAYSWVAIVVVALALVIGLFVMAWRDHRRP